MNIDDTAAWNHRLGLAWAAGLRRYGLPLSGTLVELGPGFSDKLARGLAALEFAGKVVLVEPNAAAGGWAEASYCQWLPRATVTRIAGPVTECTGLQADTLAANHLLDDLILQTALPWQLSAKLFAEMRPGTNCSSLFINQWRALLARPAQLRQLCAHAARAFMGYVTIWQPRLVVLNDYPSWRHAQHGLSAIHAHTTGLLQQLTVDLAAAGYTATVWPDADVMPASEWLIGEKHSLTTSTKE